jgi:outer membrane lipoprotein SlyB
MSLSRYGCAALAVAVLAAAGCTTVPTSPSTLALPGTGKPFELFKQDDVACRQYAFDSIGGQTATAAQTDSAVRSTVAGAAIGALIGAAVNGGTGAAVGAGVGGGAGAIAGVGASEVSGYEAQRRYDNAYTQCMYGKGHRVAVSGAGRQARYAPAYYPPYRSAYPPPPGYRYPPPPPGYYPPPPPPPGYYGW